MQKQRLPCEVSEGHLESYILENGGCRRSHALGTLMLPLLQDIKAQCPPSVSCWPKCLTKQLCVRACV